jgi:glycosyltransferase involved in cell wall biosynthesis
MKKKIAIVHDALVVPAGSEKVALNLSNIFPEAPIYTSVYLPENTFPEFKNRQIYTLPLSGLIKTERQFKSLYPIWYGGFSLWDFSKYDLIISSANYLAKFINLPASTTHICYLHNPIRFLWKPEAYSQHSIPFGKMGQLLIRSFLPALRNMDIKKTNKIDHLITNSNNIASQILNIYHQQANVIYPPVDVNSYTISDSTRDYYLYAGRLISHKKVELVIEACNQLHRKLIIAGDGLERANLEKISGSSVQFVGRVSDAQLKILYSNCKALLFPSDEDFGLVPVEVQASGRPVIAFRSGGALETVIEDQTGVFFDEQGVSSLIDAILWFEKKQFNSELIRKNAMRFDVKEFNQQITEYVEKLDSSGGDK